MYKNKFKKAFTLIELIVVIAVLGVLVLLAAPRFLGYTDDAKLVQIKNDVKVYENLIGLELVDNPDFITEGEWKVVNVGDMEEYRDNRALFDRKGEVTGSLGGEYFIIPDTLAKTNLKGMFISGKDGKVYYYDGDRDTTPTVIEYTVTFLDIDGNIISEVVTEERGTVVAPDIDNTIGNLHFRGWSESLQNITSNMTVSPIYSGPSDVDLGMENDFEWVKSSSTGTYQNKDKEKGYYKYVGTGQEIVEIPHMIDGLEMASYYRMFTNPGGNVKKVISTNENIVDMSQMFRNSQSTELDLSSFDTSKVKNMSSMFYGSEAAELDLSLLDTSNVTNMSHMFRESQAESLDLSSFDTSNVTSMYGMFSGTGADLIGLKYLDVSKVRNMIGVFGAYKGTSVDISNWDTKSVTNMTSMFGNGREYRGSTRSSVTATGENNLIEVVGLENLNTSSVTKMNSMFYDSKIPGASIFELGYDLSSLTDMTNMFQQEEATPQNIAKIAPYTKNVTDMSGMFFKNEVDELDLSSFNTSNVTNMNQMFYNVKSTSLNLSSFNTSNVTNMRHMFHGVETETLDLSSFDTSNITDMRQMFLYSTATKGYAKTKAEADIFNSSSDKPLGLNFIEK